MYDSFVVRFWVICCKIFENKSDVKEETYDTAFHLQEEEILCRDGLAVLNKDEKHSFIIFLHLFNKSFLKRQHAGNAAKCVEMDILELLKLQNILRDKPWLGQS